MAGEVHKDVVIIGAGASGLLCASECGKRGRSVLVLDHGGRTGAKVRVSGGGRCNFTNLNVSAEHYRSQNPHFCKSALAQFTPRDILSLVEKHRVPYYEKEAGQLFCVRTSRDITDLLERECRDAGVELRLKCRVLHLAKKGRFLLRTDQGEVSSDALVIATGGLSYAGLGASGFGHEAARSFGLAVTPLAPALAPFVFSAGDRQRYGPLAGVSFEAEIACGKSRHRGGVLFTHKGLSGPAALQASLAWRPGSPLSVNLLPALDIPGLFASRRTGKILVPNLLAEHLPKRFVQVWCGHALGELKPMNQTPDKELKRIAGLLSAWTFVPAGTEGYATAEVTSGGVDTDELSSKTMEAKRVPGLYFIGEVVDVTGELGGYNLHWAWASGFAAGQYA